MNSEPGRTNGEMGAGEAVGQMASGFGRLLADHLALAKAELSQQLKATGGDVGRLAAALPLILIGYCFIMSGVAVVLTRWIGTAEGLFAVGGFHILLAVIVAGASALRLKRRKWMTATVSELNQTVTVLREPNRKELPHGQ